MNKTKKLLSVLLAVVMILSTMTMAAFAYDDYENVDAYYYDSVDAPRTYLLTDEQRASVACDLVNNLLGSVNIYQKISLGLTSIIIDFRSLDSVCDTIDNLKGAINVFGGLLGLIGKLNFDGINKNVTVEGANGATNTLNVLMTFLNNNAQVLADNVIRTGAIDLGVISIDLSAVNNILSNLPNFLGEKIYGLADRQIPNGIGNDPAYPNSALWKDIALAEKPTLDTMVRDIIVNLLTTPRNTINITDPSQNTIARNPENYTNNDGTALTSDYILSEPAVDELGNPVYLEDGKTQATWYYVYVTTINGKQKFSKTGDESTKTYITRWDPNSCLVKGDAATELQNLIDFTGKDLYTLVEQALPWAFNTYGAPNLDGQFRATLMQFCGAYNKAVTDTAIQEQLKAKMDEYRDIYDASGARGLSDAFKAATGAAGNYNFMYFSLSGKDINTMPDDLYYIVEWDGSYEFYHVEWAENMSFFSLGDWEYQISDWAALTTDYTSGSSVLALLNNIIGRLVKQFIPSVSWTEGANAGNVETNIKNLIKLFINKDPQKIFGVDFKLPENFDSYDLEDIAVMIAKVVLGNLMKSLVLPDDVTSVEEILVYALREYMAEILPEYGAKWDEQIAAAKNAANKEDAFLDIALNMGASTGMYYVRNLIGVGTSTDGAKNTTVDANIAIGPDYTWKQIINYLLDWAISAYLPGLKTNIVAKFPDAMGGTDPLAKFSAILSSLAPTTGKLLGCNDSTYAVNVQTVYDTIRPILNGEFAQVATVLQRKSSESGTVGTMNVCAALATLIEELFGGLGFDAQGNDWTALQGLFDDAVASATPLQTLVGFANATTPNDAIANLAAPLLRSLAKTKNIWLQDVIKIITSFVGGFTKPLTNSGVTYEGLSAYTGATHYTIDYTFGLNTTGTRTYYHKGAYKTGSAYTMDGTYSVSVTKTEVLDDKGNVVSTKAQTATFAANESADLSIELATVPSTPKIYKVVTTYDLTLPDGSENKGQTHSKQIIVTSQMNDSMTEKTASEHDAQSGSAGTFTKRSYNYSINMEAGWTNLYMDENTPLSDISKNMIRLTDTTTETLKNLMSYHTYMNMSIPEFGWLRTADDGTIKVRTADDDTSALVDLTTKHTIKLNGTALSNDEMQNLWFKWNINQAGFQINSGFTQESGYNGTQVADATGYASLFTAENTSRTRKDFTADFTTYEINIPALRISYNYTAWNGTKTGSKEGTSHRDMNVTTYVTLYNSYNLAKILENALAQNYLKENYDTSTAEGLAAWNEYEAAIANANDQMYGQWVSATFAADHTTSSDYKFVNEEGIETTLPAGSSTFQVAAERLMAAQRALANYEKADAAAVVEKIAPSDPSSDLYGVYQTVKRMDDLKMKNQDYTLYRWYKYYDVRRDLGNALAAATPPALTPNKTLVGVDLDTAGIEALVATVSDANYSSIINGLVTDPTAEEIAAAELAYEKFEMPAYDVAQLEAKAAELVLNQQRLHDKYSTYEYYYLNDAVTKYGSVAADGYTAESYAAYTDALAAARDVLRNAAVGSGTSQSEIHAARYELLVAYNALVKAANAVDLSVLEEKYAEAKVILENQKYYGVKADATVTLEEALEELLVRQGYPVTYDATDYIIGGEYTAEYALSQKGLLEGTKKQNWVNEIVANLQAAIDNFECTIKLVEKEGDATTTVDQSIKIINGINPGSIANMDALLAHVQASDPSATLAPAASEKSNAFGTGAKVDVNVAGIGTLTTYYVLIYGDVTGDGAVDGFDAIEASLAAAGTVTLDGVYKTAADVNQIDGVTSADYSALCNVAIGMNTINQTTGELS